MESLPYWKRPERWLAFFLTFLGVCSLLAILPVPEVVPPEDVDSVEATIEAPVSFLDSLREEAIGVQAKGHWTSLLPPILAVMVASFFRSMVFALLTAFVAGGFLSFGLNPISTAILSVNDFIIQSLLSQFSLYIFLFLFSLVGMIHVVSRNGGLEGLVNSLAKWANGPRRTKVTIGLAGLILFFDDYSNTIVVGNTMQKLSDKWRISREKLAYLVDSTTAPVAGLAILSTWIAFEVMILGTEAGRLGIEESGYAIFLQMLPMRFYCIGTLIFLFMSSAMGRDFGPMFKAEKRAAETGKVVADDSSRLGIQPSRSMEPNPDVPRRMINALLPILVVVFGIVFGILILGYARMSSAGNTFSFFSLTDWQTAFGMAVDNPESESDPGVMPVLFFASVAGAIVAFALSVYQKLLTPRQTVAAYVRAMPTMWMAIFILLMTWSMQTICHTLGTSDYLIALLGDRMPPWSIPLFTFLLAAGVAFSTGTSWGAMGLLIPTVLPLAHSAMSLEPGYEIIFYLTAAAILDGAIFGDHCSPISDTTVLTSISTGCDHIAHVHTQLVYAVTTMALCGLFGYLAVGGNFPIWIFYILFPLFAFLILRFVGRPTPEHVG